MIRSDWRSAGAWFPLSKIRSEKLEDLRLSSGERMQGRCPAIDNRDYLLWNETHISPINFTAVSLKGPKRSQKVPAGLLRGLGRGIEMTQSLRGNAGISLLTGRYLKLTKLLLVLMCVFGVSVLAPAQQTTATMVGNVVDSTGAVVVGASVKITNKATNTVRMAVTDAVGHYSIPSLPAGEYSLSVEMNSFQGQRIDSIILEASQTARQDFQISAGKVSETVTVETSAAAAQLQTENGAVGAVIDGKKIVDLPLNGRNFIQLAQLIPGANSGTEGSITVRRARGALASSDATGGSTAVQVNGQRDTQNRYSIDGIESMDYDAWTYSFSTSVDAITEFRVDTSSTGTDTGAASGANVNQIIKSGTNGLHGTLFYFNRNNAFTQSYDALAKTDVAPPRLNRNQYGGNVGGPVIIPRLYDGRNKTFFFFNLETGTLLNGLQPQSAYVPSAAVRSGNIDELITAAASYSAAQAAAGKKVSPVLVNPFTQKAYVLGQHIVVDPDSLALLNATPLPNANVSPTVNYLTPLLKTLNYQHDYIVRIDHTLGRKDTLSGHYIHDVTYSNGAPFFGNDNDNNRALTQHYTATETHIFTPAIVNEFRYGRQIFKEYETFGTTGIAAFNIANGQMGIPFSSSLPEFYGPPNTTVSGNGSGTILFHTIRNIGPRNRENGINQYVDTLSWQHGRHFFKFIADLGRRTDYFSQARDPRGTFTFDGRYTGGFSGAGQPQGAYNAGLLDFLLGYIGSDSINPTVTRTSIVSLVQGYAIQDNWSVAHNFTLNLGVRWDHFPPWVQDDDRYANIFAGPDRVTPDHIVTPATSPYGRGLSRPNYYDFAPRFGFAWQPFGVINTVIRGGYGIYFLPDIANGYFQQAEGFQAQAGASLSGNLGNGAIGAQAVPNLTFSNPFPGVTTGGPSTYPFAVELYQYLADQMTQQFNLTVQTAFPGKITADIAYVGAVGVHNFDYVPDSNLPRPVNPATPGLAPVNARRPNQTFPRAVLTELSNGNSHYHSLQTKLQRRAGYGLNFLFSYTWSKSISGPADVGGLVGGGNFGATALDPLNPKADISLSIFDIPNRFVGTVLWDVPFFRHTTGYQKLLLDGFQVSTILTAVSGDPSQVTYSGPSVNASSTAARPDVVPGQVAYIPRGQRTQTRVFNTGAFKIPATATYGNSPRTGAVRLPGVFNDDLSVTKGFKFTEVRNLQFRADFFNMFKHFNPDPSTISTNISSINFGKINDGVQGGYATRVIQLGAKLYF